MELLQEEISHCYYHSPIGMIEIRCAGELITQIEFIDGEEITVIYPQNKTLVNCLTQLDEYFKGTRKTFELQFDQPGTDFQQKTWQLLQHISFGHTISYADLAKKTGNPNYIRAIAKANGKNKIAVIVPCHRVIGSDDQLVGYAWGLWRKKWLLEHESRIENGLQTLF